MHLSDIKLSDAVRLFGLEAYRPLLLSSLMFSFFLLRVVAGPIIITQPESRTAASGGIVVISIGTSNAFPIWYLWYRNGTPVPDATNSTLTFTNFQPKDAGSYKVSVGSRIDSRVFDWSSDAILSCSSPLRISMNGSDSSRGRILKSTAPGTDVVMSVVEDATNQIQYQWRFNGSDIPAATNSTLSVTNVNSTHAGYYTVLRSASGETYSSSLLKLSVVGAPGVVFVFGPRFSQLLDEMGKPLPTNYWFQLYGGPDPAMLEPLYQPRQLPRPGTLWGLVGPQEGSGVMAGPVPSVSGGDAAFLQMRLWDFSGGNSFESAVTSREKWLVSNQRPIVLPSGGLAPDTGDFLTNYVFYGNGLLSFSSSPQSQSVTIGSNVVFLASAVGSGNVRYQWYKDGTPIPGATTNTFRVDSVSVGDAGNYYVVAQTTGETVASELANLIVTAAQSPVITIDPVGHTVGRGASVTFTVEVIGAPPFGYQWTHDQKRLLGETNSSLTINNTQDIDTGDYTVEITNRFGSATSRIAHLFIGSPDALPEIITPPSNLVLPSGSAAEFSATASGTPPLSYQWYFRGVRIPSATSAEFQISAVTDANVGPYSAVVRNDAGATASVPGYLSVRSEISGTLDFYNRVPIYDVGSTNLLPAGSYLAQIVAGPDLALMEPMGEPVALFSPGRINGGLVFVPTVPALSQAFIQVRVWEKEAGSTFFDARNRGGKWFVSNTFAAILGGGVNLPADLSGLKYFYPFGIGALNFTSQPESRTAVLGSDLTFRISVGSNGPLRFQWRKNGLPILFATGSSLPFSSVRMEDAGVYSVTVSSENDIILSQNANLVVQIPLSGYFSSTGLTKLNQFEFELTGIIGKIYAIERSSDLNQWSQVCTLTNNTGVLRYSLPQATQDLQWFYRATVVR